MFKEIRKVTSFLMVVVLSLMVVSSCFAQAKTHTMGRPDSTNKYIIECKTDGICYVRDSGGFVMPVEHATTSDTLTAQETGKKIAFKGSVISTFTLPTAQVGLSYEFTAATNQYFYVDPATTETLIYSVGDVALGAGEKIKSAGATNDHLEVFCTKLGEWNVIVTDSFTNGG